MYSCYHKNTLMNINTILQSYFKLYCFLLQFIQLKVPSEKMHLMLNLHYEKCSLTNYFFIFLFFFYFFFTLFLSFLQKKKKRIHIRSVFGKTLNCKPKLYFFREFSKKFKILMTPLEFSHNFEPLSLEAEKELQTMWKGLADSQTTCCDECIFLVRMRWFLLTLDTIDILCLVHLTATKIIKLSININLI